MNTITLDARADYARTVKTNLVPRVLPAPCEKRREALETEFQVKIKPVFSQRWADQLSSKSGHRQITNLQDFPDN